MKNGEVFGLLGANGAGKSTTIECILGTKTADSGTVSIFDGDPRKDRKNLFQKIGVQFQECDYQPEIRVADCGAKFGGCFVNKFDRENPADVAMMEMLKNALGTKALNSFIPFSRVVKNSVSYKFTAPEYMGWTYAAQCCADLANEIEHIAE